MTPSATACTMVWEICAAWVNDAVTDVGEPKRMRSSPAASASTDAAGSRKWSALIAPADSESVTMTPANPSVSRRACTATDDRPAGSDVSPGIRAFDIMTALAPFTMARRNGTRPVVCSLAHDSVAAGP